MSEQTNEQVNAEQQATAADAEKPAEKKDDFQQKYLYLYADFENFKKRAFKERQDITKFALEGAASELLQVLDNLERALQFAKPDGDAQLLEGLKMVANQFKATLEKQGVTEIITENKMFTPELHEGMGSLPSDKPEGTIVQTIQKGYTLHGRLIRPARVMVSSGQPA